MKIAIVSDIHSNLEALKRVMENIEKRKIDNIYCLGDTIGYGPKPLECLKIAKKYFSQIIKGNHEYSLLQPNLGEKDLNDFALLGIQYAYFKLNQDDRLFIANLPEMIELKELGLTLVHGAYTEPRIWKYIRTPSEAKEELKKISTKICLLGHSHIPFVFGSKDKLIEDLPDDYILDKNQKYLINVGSVGQPRDGDCRACYATLEFTEDKTVFNLIRVFYDISVTENEIKNAKLPLILSERLFKGE